MTRLLLIRHGETEWNATRTIQGHADVDLSSLGVRQAERLHDRLAAGELGYCLPMFSPLTSEEMGRAGRPGLPLHIDRVIASDLRRAWKTAAIATAPWSLPVEQTPQLREMNWGRFQGFTTDYVRGHWPEEYQSWVADQMDRRPPEGETLREVAARSRLCFQRILDDYPSETVVVVAHGGSLRTGLCHLLKLPASAHWQFRLDNASLTVVDTYPEGAIVSLLNDTSHLKGLSG